MNSVKIAGDTDITRNMLACAIDVSLTEEPEYVVVGYKIESSVLEFNTDVETGTDITGNTFSSVNSIELTQSFEPHRLTAGKNGRVAEMLLKHVIDNEVEKFSGKKAVLVYGFLESDNPGEYIARAYDDCTIAPQSLGGDSWTDMPFEITFGGNMTKGSADSLIDTVAFTPEV